MDHGTVIVIGAGPGGYAAAFLAADKGMIVTLVDSAPGLGGVCLHRGCIPSKALLHLAKIIAEARDAKNSGLKFGGLEIDLAVLRQWKSGIVEKMTKGLSTLCKQRGIAFVSGQAVFKDSHTVEISGSQVINFDHAILAVGSSPAIPAPLNIGSPRIMDSTSALDLDSIPDKLLIVGGGYIGLEMGTVYSALGSRVTVAEMTDGLLPGVDRDLVRILQVRLRKDFESIHLNTKVDSIKEHGDSLQAVLTTENESREISFDKALIAVGRKPNSGNLGLKNTRVKTDDKGFIIVDENLRTADPGIYAIGDVIGGDMLAHKATHEGRRVVETIYGNPSSVSLPIIPAVVFTDPEIAWCGLAESQGIEVKVVKFPWGASGRAAALGRTDGQTKLIIEPDTGRILGVGIVGSGAGELIGEGVLAVQQGLSAQDLASTVHPHPTLSETLMEAAELFLGTATHVFRK